MIKEINVIRIFPDAFLFGIEMMYGQVIDIYLFFIWIEIVLEEEKDE